MKKFRGFTRKILSMVLVLFILFGMGTNHIAKVNAAGAAVYINGQSGNDANDGKSAGSAVKNWDKAKSLLGSNEGTIYVSGTVQAVGNISTADPKKQTVKRAPEFNGVMFEVPAGATVNFTNIDVDGEDKRIDGEVIKTNAGSKLNFLKGAKFHNIG